MSSLLILSGGLDSTVALYQFRPKIAISFNYGSKHNNQEINHAYKSCSKLGVHHYVINIDFLAKYFKSALLKTGGTIPEGHYSEISMQKTVVPFRNGIMLSIACGIAESNGLKNVIIGNHAGDFAIYPDCRDEFIDAMGKAMIRGTYSGIFLLSPFLRYSKAVIVKMGDRLGVPFVDTYSCYNGKEIQCGRCSTCYERREAFYIAKVNDPTNYIDKTPIEDLIKEYAI